MTTFDSDWKVAVDTHLLGGCSSVDGCSFAKEYVLSGYSDRWLDDQVALGGDRELRATIVKNAKASIEEQYAKMVLNGINIGLDAAIQNLQQQQQQQQLLEALRQPRLPITCQSMGGGIVSCY